MAVLLFATPLNRSSGAHPAQAGCAVSCPGGQGGRLARAAKHGQATSKTLATKAGDLVHHLDDLTHKGRISTSGLAMIAPGISGLTLLLPQPS